MKKKMFLSFFAGAVFLLIAVTAARSQGVGIGAAPFTPDASSVLEIQSVTQGILIPRMTLAQRIAIGSPATGLMVYQSDNPAGFYYYTGSAWTFLNAGTISRISDADGDTYLTAEYAPDEDTVRLFVQNNLRMKFSDRAIEPVNDGEAVFVGFEAGKNSNFVSANYNTFLGYRAGKGNTTGSYNTAVGASALPATQTGNFNTALGASAMNLNSQGSNNVAVGYNALSKNGNGGNNVGVGQSSLNNNTNGDGNIAVGGNAMFFNTSGFSNVAMGFRALYRNTNRTNLVAIGDSALYSNGIGADEIPEAMENTAVGSKALFATNTGYRNTGIGFNALRANTSGFNNTAVGHAALTASTTGMGNVAVGNHALANCTDRECNVAVGDSALHKCGLDVTQTYHGKRNTAVGYRALTGNTSGYWNTATGYMSCKNITTGYANTGVGCGALETVFTGAHNTAVGYNSQQSVTGNCNSSFGSRSLEGNGSGENNTAIGYRAMETNFNGNGNTAVGYSAGSSQDMNANSTFIGNDAESSADVTNSMALGYTTTVAADNTVRIGNASTGSIGGQVGWTTLSDERYKGEVREDIPGLNFILSLRPVSYSLDLKTLYADRGLGGLPDWKGKWDLENRRMTGFIAQEVEAAAQALGYEFSGVDRPPAGLGQYGLRYAEFVVPLVKAVQEQQKEIEQLKEEIRQLREKGK